MAFVKVCLEFEKHRLIRILQPNVQAATLHSVNCGLNRLSRTILVFHSRRSHLTSSRYVDSFPYKEGRHFQKKRLTSLLQCATFRVLCSIVVVINVTLYENATVVLCAMPMINVSAMKTKSEVDLVNRNYASSCHRKVASEDIADGCKQVLLLNKQ